MFSPNLLVTLTLLAGTFAAPATELGSQPSSSGVNKRATQTCSQYQDVVSGNYTLHSNGWGWSYGTGSQCMTLVSNVKNSLSWYTTWSWANATSQVKSYTNVQTYFAQKQLTGYTGIPTTWNWNYTGTNVRANVAYDIFLSNNDPLGAVGPNSATTWEVMVWLGRLGTVGPLSVSYPATPIASMQIGGYGFDLYSGLNGAVNVASFVAQQNITSFSGDLGQFIVYLLYNYGYAGFTPNLYLQSVQAGSEVFTGSSAKLNTTAYSISVQ